MARSGGSAGFSPQQKNLWVGLGILTLVALALLAHHLWAYVGHFGFDDVHYARLSQQFSEGVFHTSGDHYTFRWGLIWLNGLVYKAFGMGDHSSALVPMAATLLTVWWVWAMSGSLSLPARAFAMAFAALSQWVFFYSDKIMPDILVMFATTAAIASIWKHRFGRWQGKPLRSALALAASLTFCFLCKETVLLTLPLFGWLLLADVWQGKRRRFWGWAAVFGLASAVLYFSTIYALTGDVLGRVRAIAANSYFNLCSYDQLPVEHLLRRVGHELWRVFFNTGVAVGWVFLLPMLWRKDWKNLLRGSTERDFGLLCGVGLLLLSNFMSTSPTAYVPLCPDIRHYLFVVPFTGLAAAVGLSDFVEKQIAARHWAVLGLAVLAAWLAWAFEPEQFKLYGSLAAVVGLVFLSKLLKTKPPRLAAWGLFGMILLLKPAQVMRSAQTSNYPDQKRLVRALFSPDRAPRNLVVLSNKVEKNLDEYFLHFDTTGVRFLDFKQVSPTSIAAADSVALIINGTTAWLSGMDWEDMPFWVRQPDASRRLAATARGIEVYGLHKADLLQRLAAGK
ncbi:MAG: ArnT family glycosyltransferase [Saprospiraceae bacterium]